ncbi:MAG: glycosyltransferase family 2 protein, partial [Owenweeksia sp.]
MTKIDVIIPAFNEQESIMQVLKDIPKEMVQEIIVVNNNSTDLTASVAEKAGVTVLNEPRRGYGQACLAGLDYLRTKAPKPDVVVFMDADYSDHPDELPHVVAPI